MGQYFNWITSGPQTKIIKQKLSNQKYISLNNIYMNKTKKSKNYITIIKYPYNEYLQTIITIRIQLGWVKREESKNFARLCISFHKLCKVRHGLLQIATGITKCDTAYYKLPWYLCMIYFKFLKHISNHFRFQL